MNASRSSALEALVADASIVVACGAGGVGKTSAAAAIALHAARGGRRVVVITIDPARRLADAFGLAEGLDNEPRRVEFDGAAGELWATMLDPGATFDGLVREHARTTAQSERILANAFYRNVSRTLSGTHEYMAAERLHQLHTDARFDLVVVDTPPSHNALDFLDAPGTLTRFIDHRLFRMVMAPARSGLRVLNVAAQPVLRTIGKVVGGEVLADAIAFFRAFDGMEHGFRERADAVDALLRSPVTRFVVIGAPRRESVDEAAFLVDRLVDSGLEVGATLINRLSPRFTTRSRDDCAAQAAAADAAGDEQLAALWRNQAELTSIADAEDAVIEPLVHGAHPVVRAPLLRHDIHDLEGLAELATHLFAVAATEG